MEKRHSNILTKNLYRGILSVCYYVKIMKFRLLGINNKHPHCREPSLSSSNGTTVTISSEERGQGHDEELALARHWN
jgi:hypothetical protein